MAAFEDIRIVGVTREQCWPRDEERWHIGFRLSAIPPARWTESFREQRLPDVNWPAFVREDHIRIECPLDVLATELGELRSNVAQANREYRQYLAEGEKEDLRKQQEVLRAVPYHKQALDRALAQLDFEE